MGISLTTKQESESASGLVRDMIDDPFYSARLMASAGMIGMYDFMKLFWSEVSEDPFEPNWHIEKLCTELEQIAYDVSIRKKKDHDLIINIPPGTTKTITCSIMFPAWCWTKWFWMRFITASYGADLALETAEKCRDLIRSEKFKNIYPNLAIKQDKDQKSNFRVVKLMWESAGYAPRVINGGGRVSTSVDGVATGFHADIIIVDDPLNPKKAVSEVGLKTANSWMDQTLSSRKVNKAVTVTILVMQRLHEDDVTGHLLAKKKKNLRHICLPGETFQYKMMVKPVDWLIYYKDGLLDPRRLDKDVLEEMEADMGQYGYAGQVGQSPTPAAGGMFQTDHFQIIRALPAEVNFVLEIRYWDKAGTQGGGCNTAGVRMASLTNRRWVITDVKKGQWGTHERENIIKETAIADGRRIVVYIEQEPGSGGKESAESTIINLAGYVTRADRPTGDKVYRADPYSVQVNGGNVYLLEGPWNADFIKEHRDFPYGKYKDQVDAAAAAFNILSGRRVAGALN